MRKIMILMFSLVLSLSMISPIYATDSVTETEPTKVEETVEQEDITVEEVIVDQDTANEYTLKYSTDGKTVIGFEGLFVDVVIPEGVEHIGKNAFYNGKIYSIQLPSTLLSIDEQAFYNCRYLKELIIPEGVKTLGARFVSSCSELKNIQIPNTVTSIGEYAFSSCNALTQLVIPEGVYTMGTKPFNNSENLRVVLLPKTLLKMDSFGNNKNTVYYVYENTQAHQKCLNDGDLFELRKGIVVFDNNPELKVGFTMDMASYVMADPAFSNANVKVVSKNDDIVSVDENGTLTGLKLGVGTVEVTVDNYTISLLVSVSDELLSLVDGYVAKCSKEAVEIVIPDGVLGVNAKAFEYCENLTSVSIPDTITRIEEDVFRGCTSLTSIEIPSGVTYIGQSAFEGCTKLTSISIPSGVTSIKSYTFQDCTSLTNVFLPDALTTISSQAFENCTSLERVVLPSSLKTVGSHAFSNCPKLVLVIGNNEAIYKYAEKNKLNYETVVENIELDEEFLWVEGTECNLEVVFVPYFANTYTDLTWTSSNEEVVSVSETGELAAVYSGKTTLTATTANGKIATCEVTVLSPIEAISFEKEEYTFERKETVQLKPVYNPTYTNSTFTWSSSDESVATVDQNGFVTALHSGSTTITISADNGVSTSCVVNVKPVSVGVEVSIPMLTLNNGETYQLSAKVYPESSNQTVTWMSTNASCVKVDNNGLITAMYPGKATIIVTSIDGYTDMCEVEVVSEISLLALNYDSITVAVGKTVQLSGIVYPFDQIPYAGITWTSKNTNIATVNNKGVVTGKSAGETVITATTKNGISAECKVYVDTGLTANSNVMLLKDYILLNGEYDEENDITFIEYKADKRVYYISVSNTGGVSFESYYYNGNPTEQYVNYTETWSGFGLPDYGYYKNTSMYFEYYLKSDQSKYTKTYSIYGSHPTKDYNGYHINNMTVWGASDFSLIDSLSNKFESEMKRGFKHWNTMVKNAIGRTLYDFGFKNYGSSSGKTTVLAKTISLDKEKAAIDVGNTLTLKTTITPSNATNKKVTWVSSNPEVATVSSKGVVSGKSVGTVMIIAMLPNGIYDYCEIAVGKVLKEVKLDKSKVNIELHETVDLVATINPTDTTQSRVLTWTSSNPEIATVDQTGHVEPKALGTTTITVTASNGKTATCTVNVVKPITSITLDKETVDLMYGETAKLTASILPLDTTDSKTITWTSSDKNVATVDKTGKVTTKGPGTATITAKTVNGLTATCTVTVKLQEVTTKVARASDTSLKVSWNKVNGASGYEVYRSTTIDGTYKKVATITSGSTTSYTNSKLTNATTYFYKVRAYRTVNGKKLYGEYSDVVGYAPLKTPSVTAKRTGFDSITLTWKTIKGADSYEIYRSTDNKNYELLTTTSAFSYFDNGLLTAKTYYYKVKAVKDCTTNNAVGAFSTVQSAKTTLDTPKVTVTNPAYNRNELTWVEVVGADGYEVVRATKKDGKYTVVGTVETAAYEDTNVKLGTTYYYKVRAYHNNVDESKGYSSYSAIVNKKVAIVTPKVTITANYEMVNLDWQDVELAKGYEVYRATKKDGKYSKVATVEVSSYEDTNVVLGKTYYYKVRAVVDSNGTDKYSSYSAIVSKKVQLATPTSLDVVKTDSTSSIVYIENVQGADGYEVYRATKKDGTYKLVVATIDTTYVDTGLASKTYYYKVRAYRDHNGSRIYSGYTSVFTLKK